MAHRTPAPLRVLGRLLKAVLGLVVLAVLVAGIPLLLLKVGYQPTELSGGWDLLTRQDDGTLFLTALTCIGWAAWASFAFSTLVELVAVLRRQKAPKIRGLGGLQSLAGFLIGSIVLIGPAAAASVAAPQAVAATTHHTLSAGPGTQTAAPTASSSTAPAAPTHTVTSSTELAWDLAEQYLGDGKRWKDIAALNPGIPELVAGDQYLPQGTVLTLPADARLATPPAADNSPAAEQAPPAPDKQPSPSTGAGLSEPGPGQPATETVKPADTLSDIADRHGDPNDWPALFEANRGKPQPGGGTFTDPNLIYPGQQLDLPASWASTPRPPSADVPPPAAGAPAPDPGTQVPAPVGDEHPGQAQQPAPPSAAPSTIPSPTPSPGPPSVPAPAASAAPTAPAAPLSKAPEPVVAEVEDPDSAVSAGVWMGAGALAAALVGTLTVRRILQQRRRRPGRRIPMPKGRAAQTEQHLRAVQHPSGFELLDRALRSLALNLADTSRELPAIEAVVLHDAKIELHLTDDSAPMKPFTSAVGRSDLWTCLASSPHLADEEALRAADVPYPALISVGWDTTGHLVLVDLEHVGVLQLAGDADFARHVLQAIAVELANTPLPGHLEVTALADTAPGLDTAVPERVARTRLLAEAAAELVGHAAEQRRALENVGASSLRTARLLEDGGDSWTPLILLAQDLSHEDTTAASLLDTLAAHPRVAGALVCSSTRPEHAGGWTLTCKGPNDVVVLPGSDLPVRLQGLSDTQFADAIELLTVAASDIDVPASERTDDVLDDPRAVEDLHVGDPSAGEMPTDGDPLGADLDGLPGEYAEGEVEAPFTTQAVPSGQAAPAVDAGLTLLPAARTKDASADDDASAAEEPGSTGLTLADVYADADLEHPEAPRRTTNACAPRATAAVHVTLPASPPTAIPEGTARDIAEPTAVPEQSSGPSVLLLGPVRIDGAGGRIDSSRLTVATELIAYLALNTGIDHHAIDNALWPGHRENKNMRNKTVSLTRSWLGKDTEGNPHLRLVQKTGDSRYRLGTTVTSDWTRFQHLTRTGMAHHDEDGDLALRRALALVRGRPFADTHPQRYAWAEPLIQEMISTIADAAYELSTRRREAGDIPSALWAARQGLLAGEENELLHRCLFLAHHAAGDLGALREAAARLTYINEQLDGGVDMEAETAQLLRDLLPRPIATAARGQGR
ncbi:LysM peptidoglycan-binding domain-containing protein [Streptomyces sp. H27-H1]|uniref:LysM peptidoglycan-binding domain-containing protein n=1 Tax=Streptomyces sp. H27-H1 TaxID=2996461 RepID=UPI00226E2898|nr:LysM peptidoglycan-binding domain-containing protein [Streptomyces sp. H27-H1]MCY0931651.1 LysM peptidoglycan-binding domain-containing protein [Streptomyces sp. H27-H1]